MILARGYQVSFSLPLHHCLGLLLYPSPVVLHVFKFLLSLSQFLYISIVYTPKHFLTLPSFFSSDCFPLSSFISAKQYKACGIHKNLQFYQIYSFIPFQPLIPPLFFYIHLHLLSIVQSRDREKAHDLRAIFLNYCRVTAN